MAAALAEEADDPDDNTNFDILVIAPCPGNFLAKLVNARSTSVSLARPVKYLQSGKPVVLALVANGNSEKTCYKISSKS